MQDKAKYLLSIFLLYIERKKEIKPEGQLRIDKSRNTDINRHVTQNEDKQNTSLRIKKTCNTYYAKTWGLTHVFVKDNQLMFLIIHTPVA